MKKIYLTMVAALLGASSLWAQTTIATLGFESGDEKGKSSAYALTPGLSAFGDWVNVKEDDVWNEQYTEDKKSGEFSLFAQNDFEAGNSWDRGFKIAKLPIKENTPYRVSFWIKAEPTYTDETGIKNTSLTSWLSQGIENFDKSICTPSGFNYGVQMTSGLTGEWQRISFVSYYTNADVLNNIIADQSWVGNAEFPEEFGGDGTQTYAEFFDHKLPNEFFLIINMFSPTTYVLDDIKVEEGVTFNAATFSPTAQAIKLDFGYQTNIANLANDNNGSFSLDPSCVTVTINGTPAEVEFVEGKSDGFLYVFLTEDTMIEDEDEVRVSFTPAEDCPIVYPTDRRPSSDIEGEMKVLGFQNEVAYLVDNIDALPSVWSPAVMVSSVPENESFEIDPATFKNIAVTYDKPLSLTYASATLAWKDNFGDNTLDLTKAMTLSEDGKTINTAVSDLANGEYTFTLSGVSNSYEVACEGDQVITFAVGPDTDTSISEVVYSTNETFANTANGTFPVGWLANDNGTIHQYGLTDNGEVWNYNWGGNVGGGGCRAMTGYSGDLNGAAIYWRSMNGSNTLGTLTYGEQVKDYVLGDGSIDPEMPEGISLQLDARKYQITIRMCAWKNLNGNTDAINVENAPKYDFTLEDLNGNVYARFKDVIAMPNVNGAQNMAVTGVTRSVTDFTVDKAGYYMLKFSTTQPNGEYLLGGVDLITMPSKAAYWKQQLAAAVEAAEAILEEAEDEMYDGETKTAFMAAINNAENGHFTSPSEITAIIAELEALGAKMQARVNNINAFDEALINASNAYAELDGKYLESEIAINAQTMLDAYENTNPSDLSDEELAEVTPKLVTAAAQLANVKSVTDILAWRGYKAFQVANQLGVESSEKYDALNLVEDNDAVVENCNVATTIALYTKLAENPTLLEGDPDDFIPYEDEVEPNKLKTTVNYDAGTKIVVDGEYTDMTGEEVAACGIDFTSLVKNPRFYTYTTDGSAPLQDNTVVGWMCEQYEGGSVHLANNASATAENPVITSAINSYANGSEYKFYQVIENAPVGIYDVYFATRTAIKNQADPETEVVGVFNAMDDETGIWDKYIFAQVDDEEPIMAPFAAGSSWFGHPTVIPQVTVKEGQKLTIGVIEHLVSGKASGHDYAATDFWNTNTFAGEARMYFVAPLAGYDYAAAAKALADGIDKINTASSARIVSIYSVSGARMSQMQKGVNIVKRADGTVSKVLVK